MPDARHPKPYPRGPKHPKLEVSPAWKRRVDAVLDANKRAGIAPGSRTELARLIKANKAGVKRMLDGDQASYKYAKQISELLGIPLATVANPELSDDAGKDDWDRVVAKIKQYPAAEQRRWLKMFQAAIDDAG